MEQTSAERLLNLAEAVLPYLPPADFMHIIEASKYLYEKYRGKIPEKRRQSLIRYIDLQGEDFSNITFVRSTKLSNGLREGKSESLDKWHYTTQEYVNGQPTGHQVIYKYLWYKTERLLGKDKKLLRRALLREFRAWADIDTSGMKLVYSGLTQVTAKQLTSSISKSS